jgi:GTP:adenosylcobinamide-phosphate guanylyltransferase
MNAFIAAGGIPGPDEPLFDLCQGRPKALLPIGGKPMIQWVIDALDGAAHIGRITVVGLEPSADLTHHKPTDFVPDQGGLMRNMLGGLAHVRQLDPKQEFALYTAADIPGVTPAMVDWRVELALEAHADIDYVAVDRQVMEARYPASRRSYVKFKDAEVCGSDMNVVRTALAVREGMWNRLIEARKHPMQQAAMLGYGTLILLLLRRLTLEATEARVTRRLELDGRVHLCPYAEIAMDVDKPHQYQILADDLQGRVSTQPA